MSQSSQTAINTREMMIPVSGGEAYLKQWEHASNSSNSVNTDQKFSTATPISTPIFMHHDSIGCVELWGELPEQLAIATGRTVFAYDRLGFGKSTALTGKPQNNFLEEESNNIFPAIKQHLSISKHIAFGHSAGGVISVYIAANDPDCQAVISIASIALVEELTLQGIEAAKGFFSKPENFARLARRHGDKTEWVLKSWFETWGSEAFDGWNIKPQVSQVKCPLLVIHGAKDEYGTMIGPTLLIENTKGESELVVLNDCAHFPHREKPEVVLGHVQRFLKSSYQ